MFARKADSPGVFRAAIVTLAFYFSSVTAAGATLSVRLNEAGTGLPLGDVVVLVTAPDLVVQDSAQKRGVIEQRNQQFEPRLLVIKTGSAVEFPNQDATRHHVYSFSHAKTFEIRLYHGLPATPIIFDKPGAVALGCNIHDRMQAFIYVTDADLWRVTEASGSVELPIPASVAAVTLEFWHPRLRGGAVTRVIQAPFPDNLAVTLDVRPPLPAQSEPASSLQNRFNQLMQ